MQNTVQNLKPDKRNHVENAARSTRRQAHGDVSAKRHGVCKLMIHNKNLPEPAKFLLYQTEDGQTRLEVAFRGETCWLSLNQLAELFQRDKSVISRHIKNIFYQSELARESVDAKFATTVVDSKIYQVNYYNKERWKQ